MFITHSWSLSLSGHTYQKVSIALNLVNTVVGDDTGHCRRWWIDWQAQTDNYYKASKSSIVYSQHNA